MRQVRRHNQCRFGCLTWEISAAIATAARRSPPSTTLDSHRLKQVSILDDTYLRLRIWGSAVSTWRAELLRRRHVPARLEPSGRRDPRQAPPSAPAPPTPQSDGSNTSLHARVALQRQWRRARAYGLLAARLARPHAHVPAHGELMGHKQT